METRSKENIQPASTTSVITFGAPRTRKTNKRTRAPEKHEAMPPARKRQKTDSTLLLDDDYESDEAIHTPRGGSDFMQMFDQIYDPLHKQIHELEILLRKALNEQFRMGGVITRLRVVTANLKEQLALLDTRDSQEFQKPQESVRRRASTRNRKKTVKWAPESPKSKSQPRKQQEDENDDDLSDTVADYLEVAQTDISSDV
ncbi:hypothetical protein FZEAL_8590 [Fusarium zealandicum]|uniref:Uncharacterized protein n=1 Tax=Fusarium zealandicum TaxID=1053134 RepID=A0A8H4UEI4_9HYPO|nr:hypothetical protein FZEAL_8590 [Fusarium zealandicum]